VSKSQLGLVLKARRNNMELSLSALSREMGGSPGESFVSRIESGSVTPSALTARRMAEALQLPADVVLPAAGHATEDQMKKAYEQLRQLVGAPAPVVQSLPVRTVEGGTAGTRQRLMRKKEAAFIIDLTGAPNEPYVGEAIVATERTPVSEQGVVVNVEGKLSAWTFYDEAGGVFLENGRKERRTKGFTVLGVILRVATERELVEE